MRYTGNGEGHTLLILTDAESRLIRQHLARAAAGTPGDDWLSAVSAFNRGIQRGTDKMAEESKADWKKRSKPNA